MIRAAIWPSVFVISPQKPDHVRLQNRFASVGELPCERLETGTHTETFKSLLSSVLFPTPSSHKPSTEESAGGLPGADWEGRACFQGIAPRPALNYDSSRSPCTGWPCHRGMAVSQKTAVRMESFECRSAAQGRKGSARRPPVHKPGLFWALCLQLPEGTGSRASRWALGQRPQPGP